MSAARPRARGEPGPKRTSRRLARDVRREQLIDVAMPIVAKEGLGSFSLDEIARGADVTRNLLYHYFPRGREDILVAVGERAGHELTDNWVTDESVPLQERMAINFLRFFEHAEEPSFAWRIHRMARASTEPELHAIIDRFEEVVVAGVSQNNFGTTDPPQIVRIAIKAFIVFGETLLDEARESGVQREEATQLMSQAFLSTIEAVRPMLT